MHKQEIIFLDRQMSCDRSLSLFELERFWPDLRLKEKLSWHESWQVSGSYVFENYRYTNEKVSICCYN